MSILIAVPTFESIKPETFKSIYGLSYPPELKAQYGPLMFDFIKGYDCAVARNKIAKEAIEYGFQYVLMVDSDIVLPSNTLEAMLETPTDICLGIYLRKGTTTGQTELFKLNQPNFIDVFTIDELDMKDRFDIKGGGLGCALIHVEIFTKLAFPWFNYVTYPSGDVLSEDNYFCSNASAAGYSIQADARVICGHIMQYVRR